MKTINHHIRTPKGRSLGAHYPEATKSWVTMTPGSILEAFENLYGSEVNPTESDLRQAYESQLLSSRKTSEAGLGNEPLPDHMEDWHPLIIKNLLKEISSLYWKHTPKIVLVDPPTHDHLMCNRVSKGGPNTSIKALIEERFKVEIKPGADRDDLYFLFI